MCVVAAEADVMVARKGGHIKVSIPEDNGDSDIERRDADGMWSFLTSFVLVTLFKSILITK